MRNFQNLIQAFISSRGHATFQILDGVKYGPTPEGQHTLWARLIKHKSDALSVVFICIAVLLNEATKVTVLSQEVNI